MKVKKLFGPSTLIAAAFIGPGTLTTCTIAGVKSAYTLIWALLFAIMATIILQEMAARLGFSTQEGLGEAFNKQFPSGVSRYIVFALVISAIVIGNAAYEAGNIAGGIMGLDLLIGPMWLWPLLIGVICFALLYFGKYKWVERILVALVLTMSFCFLITAIIVKPDLGKILNGLIPLQGIDENFLLVMALIGTTVVPYNLFLHASTISKKWKPTDRLSDLRLENATAILLGGVISILIVITAASTSGTLSVVTSAKDLALQLEPVFGSGAKWLMGIGLMAAGVSSALTAPLAAAYAAKGLFGWQGDETNPKFRGIWMMILLIGVLVAITGIKPVTIIKFAQITNALLLPLISGYLLYMANQSKIMGKYTNGIVTNGLGAIVILITVGLSVKTLIAVL